MIKSPENYVLVEIEKKFQDKEGAILIDPTWHPEEFATLEGIIVSTPCRMLSDSYRTIVGSVAVGDKVFFSYGIIFEYDEQKDNDTPTYRNLIIYQGREYWKVHIGEIFCVIKEDGVEMVTENILLTPIKEEQQFTGLYIPQKDEKNIGEIIGMPNMKLDCQKGDKVIFEPQFVQEYNIFGNIHYIIPARRVIAKWI